MPPRRRPPARARTELPPLKIIRRIILLQLAYYGSGTALILFTTVVYGTPFSLDLIFSWDALRGDTTIGWMLGLVWMLNSLICVIYLLLLVSRSKLIPDFALTLHFIHLIATCLYSRSVPQNWLWWGLQCASAACMTFGGIWACQWRELKPISFGGLAGTGTATGAGIGTGAGSSTGQRASPPERGDAHPNDDEDGSGSSQPFLHYSRGRGLGRDLRDDGGGEYEMVRMKELGDEAV